MSRRERERRGETGRDREKTDNFRRSGRERNVKVKLGREGGQEKRKDEGRDRRR